MTEYEVYENNFRKRFNDVTFKCDVPDNKSRLCGPDVIQGQAGWP